MNGSMNVGNGFRSDYPRFIHQLPIFSQPIDDVIGYSRGHAVLLIGKRIKNGRRQYLLRNSTPFLGSSDWDWVGDYYHNVWVDADILVQAILKAAVIQRR